MRVEVDQVGAVLIKRDAVAARVSHILVEAHDDGGASDQRRHPVRRSIRIRDWTFHAARPVAGPDATGTSLVLARDLAGITRDGLFEMDVRHGNST
jgi:hypothetical protein